MIRPYFETEYESRKDVNLEVEYEFKRSNKKWNGIPICATNMSTVGTIGVAKVLQNYKVMTFLHKFYSIDEIEKAELNPDYFVPTIGLNDIDKIKNFKNINFINVDVAQGYTKKYAQLINEIKQKYPEIVIISGVVATPEGTEKLLNAGSDIIKLGLGTGGHCTTASTTGVSYPIISCLKESFGIACELSGHILADGGCRFSGDISKAFVAGASFVSVGSMFSAHKENTNEIIEKDGKQFAKVYGMSSNTAMNEFYGGRDNYKSSEGSTSLMPYKGEIAKTIEQVLGALRSTATYIDAKNISDFRKAKFIRTNQIRNTTYDVFKVGE